MGKKGVSTVVAVVLLILIAVAAIIIVWTVVLPLITLETERIDFNVRFEVVDLGTNTVYDNVDEHLSISIRRYVDESTINNIRIILEDSGTTYSVVVPSPGINQATKYIIDTNFGSCDVEPKKVRIAPLIIGNNGLESEGIAMGEVNIPVGNFNPVGTIYILDGC